MPRIHVHLSFNKILENIETAREKKLDIEIYFSALMLDNLKEKELHRVKESLDWNPQLSFHAPYLDMNPGGMDERVRRIAVERFLQIIGVAKILRPKTIVFHTGYDKWRFHGYEDTWFENSLKTWGSVLENANGIGTAMAIENVFEEDPSIIERLINKIDSPKFGVCFDTGHFQIFSKIPMKEWLDRLGHRLLEVHVHDNNGVEDEHLAIGDGKIDFDHLFELLNTLPHKPILTIEAHNKETAEKSIERIKKYL